MSKVIRISEGSTYEYLIHGVVAIIIGGILAIVSPIFILVGLVIGIGLMAAKTVIEVDIENLQMRKCSDFLVYKSGSWVSLKNIVQADLIFNVNSGGNTAAFQMGMFFRPIFMGREDRRMNTYDLWLIDDVGDKKLFNPFAKYSLANKVIKQLQKLDGLEVNDQFGKRLKESRSQKRR
jgi:hypothetical protein